MTVGLGNGVYVGVKVGVGGVYMAVCVPNMELTIVPTTEVINASLFCVGASVPPAQAVRRNAIKITASVWFMYFFIIHINLTQNHRNQADGILPLTMKAHLFFIEQYR